MLKIHIKNHRKVVSDLPGKIVGFPPPPVTTLTSKCHNFFSIGSLSSLEMHVRQKFSLCLFSQFFLILSVSHYFCLVFGQKRFFWLKFAYIDGKQTNWIFFQNNKKFECFRCFFIPWLYQKLQIWKSYDCSNTRLWWKKLGMFLVFPKKAVIYTKLLLFFGKIRKIPHFFHHRRVFEQS